MTNSILKFLISSLLIFVINISLNGQCFNGIISGFSKTEYCVTENTNVNLLGQTEFFGDIEAPISPIFSISPSVGSGFTDNGDGTANFNPNQVGIGTFTITLDFDSGLDCKELGVVTFTVFEVESIAIEVENTACGGSPLNLATSETFENIISHSWTGPNNFTSSLTFPTINNASNLNSGRYAVTVTYETGCTATASRDITISPNPTFELNANDPTCVGENLTIQVSDESAGGTYSWTGPNNFTSTAETVNINNLTTANAGTYSLTYTTGANCSTTSAVAVTLSTLPEPILATSGDFCGGDAALVLQDNSNINYEYVWFNQNNGNIFNEKVVTINNPLASDAGTYSVSVTNSVGCEVIETINVAYNGDAPQLEITGDNAICSGGSIQLSETSGNGQNHVWTGPNSLEEIGATVTIDNVSSQNAGLYTVTADNGNGCSGSTNINITINSLPSVNLTANNTAPCEGETLTLSETNGELIAWIWTGPNNFSSDQPSPNIPNLSLAASGTYKLIGRNAQGCETESTIDIDVNARFNAGTSRDLQVCNGAQVDLTILIEDADPDGIFFDDSGTGTLTGTILETAGLAAGDYNFSYSLAETSVCIGSTSFFVRVQDSLNAGGDLDLSICQNETLDLSTTLTEGSSIGGEFIDIGESGALSGNQFDGSTLKSSNLPNYLSSRRRECLPH